MLDAKNNKKTELIKNIMKNITLLLLSIVLLNSCSNSNNNYEEFLTNFETKTEFPLIIEADTTGNLSNNLKEIDEKFLHLFVDTANRFQVIDGVKKFDTHYYYYAKINNENSNFYTLIIANKMAEFMGETDKIHLEYNVYTVSKEGVKIAEKIIASDLYVEDTEYTYSLYSSVIFITDNKFDLTEIENTQENTIKQKTTPYFINDDGTIGQDGASNEEEIKNKKNNSLYDTFLDLVKASNYNDYFDYVIYNTKDETSGMIINEEKKDDYFNYKFWAVGGYIDSVCFQLLAKRDNYEIYILHNKGQKENPWLSYNSIQLYKLTLSDLKWHKVPLLKGKSINDEYFNMSFSYDPITKIIYDYKELIVEDNEHDIYVNGELKSKYVWSETEGKFIKEQISELPNPIIVTIDITSPSEYANYSDATIVPNHYFDEELKGKTTIRFAVEYQLTENQEYVKASDRMMEDIIKNTDTKKKFFIKYKMVKIMEGEAMGEPYKVDAKIIEDYEVITDGDIIATFEDYIMSDLPIYTFTSRLGYHYQFDGINDSKYQFEKGDAPNPEYIGKKFKIHFNTSKEKDDYNDRIVEFNIIDKIEIIEN
ncbi:MAG: hypothetical protein DRJ01_11985 [Bacteroidetes bacterium]|nr:MAG: hypothetical protein DRJ01_11985 [Bacteroidota bacterium]